MQQEMQTQRIVDAAQFQAWRKLLALSLVLALCLGFAWLQSGWPALLLGSVALCFVLAQFAFLGHDAGHGSIHQSSFWNGALGHFCMTVVTGLAFAEWYSRHQAHHRHCQDEALDPDMDVSLLVSLTEQSRQSKGWLGRFLTQHQHLHVWFLSLFFAHSQRHLSQWGVLNDPRRFWKDLIPLALHVALWFGVPVFVFGVEPARAAWVYVLPLFFLGPYLAALFWLNHIGMPLVRSDASWSFLEHQSLTSRTVLSPKSMDWFFGGLNYQIEHHLYPKVPSFRLRRVQPIVQQRFAREALAYNGVGFVDAVRHVAAHFRSIAKAAA